MSLLLALVAADVLPPEPEPVRRASSKPRERHRYEVDRFNYFEAKPIAIRNDDDECLVLMMM